MVATPISRPRVRGAWTRFAWRYASVLALIAGAIVWEVSARAVNMLFLPPLSKVIAKLVELIADGRIIGNLTNSLGNLATGYAIALVLGVGLGLLMGAYPAIDAALDPYVTALNSTPGLVFAPIFFTLFGLSKWSIVALIVLSTSIFLIINTASAIRAVSPELIEMARSFSASDRQMFAKVLVPAALPFILGTARLAGGRGVRAMINGEMFINAVGLGAIVIQAAGRFDATTILAVLFVIGAVGFAVLKALQLLEERFTGWVPAIDATSTTGGNR